MISPENAMKSISSGSVKLRRELTLAPLFGLMYFTVCGGPFGAEAIVGWSGPGLALVLLVIVPLVFSLPCMLMVREMTSMMPVEGGYYHWVKQAFGPFAGFMTGWMNWVVSWVDVSIYPVLAAYYLAFFIPALRDGIALGGLTLPSSLLSWLVALALIWIMSYLSVRGARLAGLTANWVGLIMMCPLIIMCLLGVYQWIHSGVTASFPILPKGKTVIEALSTGLFVAMWNFMGWELPTAANEEVVNPRKTYPTAMLLVFIATIATYLLPIVAGLYGGAGENGRYQLWGIEEYKNGQGIGKVVLDYGIDEGTLSEWGVSPSSSTGWGFPDIAQAIGAKVANSGGNLSHLMGGLVTISAVLSMIGLFVGNSLGGTRVPFSLAQDGMLPKWLVKIHPKYGTPWISIVFCGVLFSVFSLKAFASLVIIDVFLNVTTLIIEFMALWRLRFIHPNLPRQRVPGGFVGLSLVTLGPSAIFTVAIVSQLMEQGLRSLGLALAAIGVGAVLYIPIRRFIKPGVPDIDPFATE